MVASICFDDCFLHEVYLQNSGITTSSTESITCMLQNANGCSVTILGDEHVSISVNFNVPTEPVASVSLFTLFMDSSTVDWKLLTIYKEPSITSVEVSNMTIGSGFNITYSGTDLTLPNIDTGIGAFIIFIFIHLDSKFSSGCQNYSPIQGTFLFVIVKM